MAVAGTPPLASPRRVPASSVRPGPPAPHGPDWARLELMLLQEARGSVPMIFKPTVDLHDSTTDNSTNPLVPQGGIVYSFLILSDKDFYEYLDFLFFHLHT